MQREKRYRKHKKRCLKSSRRKRKAEGYDADKKNKRDTSNSTRNANRFFDEMWKEVKLVMLNMESKDVEKKYLEKKHANTL